LDATAIEAMVRQFRVVDLTSEQVRPDVLVDALSPEDAVEQALGLKVVRSGFRRNLVARVYWQTANAPLSMVRLYTLDP
jgi:hypothetical protein